MRGGMHGDGHEVSILIRLGDGDRAGRGAVEVSTTIIRPPQHGQRRKAKGHRPRLSAPAHARWGADLGRGEQLSGALDVRARTAPANRP